MTVILYLPALVRKNIFIKVAKVENERKYNKKPGKIDESGDH